MKEEIEVTLETDPEFNKVFKELEKDVTRLNRIADTFQRNMKSALGFYDAETRKIAEITKIGEKQTQDMARGWRQSHGELRKLKKDAQEVKDLFDSLYKAPAKFKPFKPFNVQKDILEQMGVDNFGKEMMDAASSVRKGMEDENKGRLKEFKKHLSLYKEWRKGLTGVLIDLHWFRILGSQSRVLGTSFDLLGKSLGYLVDVILLPMLPHIFKLSKFIIDLAVSFQRLPKVWRDLITNGVALGIAITTMATAISYAYAAVTAFTAAIIKATGATTGRTIAETGGVAALGGVAVGGAAVGGGILSGGGMAYLNDKLLGTGTKAAYNRYALISKLFGKNLPLMAEGGIATKPTAGIFGEGGAEAIIPLSKIGEVLGGILGSGAAFAGTLSQAAMGALGAGAGGGLNMPSGGGGAGGVMVKGFSWVAGAINAGFKIANELLAAILALLAQGTGGAGGGSFDPIKFAEDAWSAITLAAKTAWDIITAKATEVWNVVLATAKWVWDSVYSLAEYAWNGIITFAGSVWDNILTTATTAWTTITDVARNAWDNILTTAQTVWTSIGDTSKQVWDQIFVIADDVWERIHDKHITLIDTVLALLPKPSGGTTTGGGTPTPTGGGTTGGGTPIFEGLQKVFEGGVYIGDWELYSDGSKKWRPNPNAGYAGSTAPPSGAETSSPGGTSGGGITAYITEGADNYAYTVNTAMQDAAETTSSAVTDSTASFTDVFVDSVTAVGSMVWNTFSDVAETVYSTVTGAVGTVVSAAGNAIVTANNWLSNTFGGLGQSVGVPAPPFIPPLVASFQHGGIVPNTGLAFLHEGETVIPKEGNAGQSIIINNPTFQISGRTDREMFENFMRMMKTEGARVR